MDFLSGRKVEDLFDNNSFVDAIRKKDKCEVKKTIRKTCSFHLEWNAQYTSVQMVKSQGLPIGLSKCKQQNTLRVRTGNRMAC